MKATAQDAFDAWSAGEYGAEWDVWTAAGQKAVPRARYVQILTLCPPLGQGLPLNIKKITITGDKAAVRVSMRIPALSTVLTSYNFLYEDGAWRWTLSDSAIKQFRGTAKQAAARMRAAGKCAKS